MSKTIQVTGKWEGSVEIADPLNIEQAQAIADSLDLPQKNADGTYYTIALDAKKIPAILACVEKWNLKGFPETVNIKTYPASPRKAAHALANLIHSELVKVYVGDTEVPNE